MLRQSAWSRLNDEQGLHKKKQVQERKADILASEAFPTYPRYESEQKPNKTTFHPGSKGRFFYSYHFGKRFIEFGLYIPSSPFFGWSTGKWLPL